MGAPGHMHSTDLSAWMKAQGVASLSAFVSIRGRLERLGEWGAPVGEPPHTCQSSPHLPLILSRVECMRLAELRAAGQQTAQWIPLGEGVAAWLTSFESGFRLNESGVLFLRLLLCDRSNAEAEAVATSRANTAAHDIRNQLSLALLRLERLEGCSDESLRSLRGALRAGRSMCNSFLESGIAHDEFALRPLLEEEIRSAIDSAGSAGLRVALKCSSEFVAYGDEAALRRFTQNALLNALSVSPLTTGPRVEVASTGNGLLRLSVTDAGPGMSARGVERAYTSGASGVGSTGFGTDSMSQAASDLGSSLKVSTGQGAGTRVSVEIQGARDGKPVAVVLDRDPVRRTAVLKELREEGWWCAAPSSVEAALGAMERLGAAQVLVARGCSGSSTTELIETSGDLDIPCREYSCLAEL